MAIANSGSRYSGRSRVILRSAAALALAAAVMLPVGMPGQSYLGAAPAQGDMVRIEAGCDRRAETCRLKFNNFLNFRGFPHIPGEDWVMSYPVSSARNDGGSLSG